MEAVSWALPPDGSVTVRAALLGHGRGHRPPPRLGGCSTAAVVKHPLAKAAVGGVEGCDARQEKVLLHANNA